MKLLGGIEAGGTKFVCAIGTKDGQILDEVRFPTTTPEQTISQAVHFFRDRSTGNSLEGVGVGSFGPIDPLPGSSTYGFITSTPKPGWQNTDICGGIGRALGIPIGFDTDVNAAGLGEATWGAAKGLDTFIYLTIGTGIGGGGLINGKLLHGLIHPEMGHILIPHDRTEDPFQGACPFHQDCFEGLASGPAIEKRWGQRGETIPADHPAWTLEAHYVALALASYICVLSPQRIILGGGIMQQEGLLDLVRIKTRQALNGYVQSQEILYRMEDYIVLPGLGIRSGILGALALAAQAVNQRG